MRHTTVERVSGADAVSLATDLGPVPMQVGAVLLLDGQVDPTLVATIVARRAAGVPRLRQHLVSTPVGAGRPIWVETPDFDAERHVTVQRCPPPGDRSALLASAAETVWARLDPDQPQWRAVVVDGLTDGGAALIVTFHHVLADGIGGLAVLAHLMDAVDEDAAAVDSSTAPPPTTFSLVRDAWLGHLRSLRALPAALRSGRAALEAWRSSSRPRASRSSLNRPTGPDRVLAVARVELAPVHELARRSSATINDVMLTCTASALHEVLGRRGDPVDRLVVSVPVSTRRSTDLGHLGNEVGTALIEIPTVGPFEERLTIVAHRTRSVKGSPPGAASVVAPMFRLLARLGAFRWFIDHQRSVNTFVTNLRGPEERLTLAGCSVDDVIPVALITGNVPIAFAVLSYAGHLDVTIVADPAACPDWRSVHEELQNSLDRIASPA